MHQLATKVKIFKIPVEFLNDDRSIVLPVGVVPIREGFIIINECLIHLSGINENTWATYGIGLFGEKVVMKLDQLSVLSYGSRSLTLYDSTTNKTTYPD